VTQDRAVFLDRDGTMIEDVGYLDRLERLKLFPYTVDAVRLLNSAGFKVVVVTSQNGVASGMLTEQFLGEAHAHLSRMFEVAGAKVEGYYYCPHSPHASVERYRTECECRKPKPGMILAAARDHGLDVARSFVVGDRWRDIGAGGDRLWPDRSDATAGEYVRGARRRKPD
jgi:D-glycero-D-manno-heptose 1,7-bisphosphate phosphatase